MRWRTKVALRYELPSLVILLSLLALHTLLTMHTILTLLIVLTLLREAFIYVLAEFVR